MDMNRRQFFKVCGVGLGASSMAALGMALPTAYAESIRHFKLTNTRETRNTCPLLLRRLRADPLQPGQRRQERRTEHHPHRRRPDHPVNRGTLCSKGAGLLDFVHSPNRLTHPEVREAGSNEWKRIEWSEALDRIARLMKDDRDANFIERNDKGQTVNRWLSTGFLAASASSNEAGYITHKVVRSLGMLGFDNQARLTRPDGGKSCPDAYRGAMTNHWSDIQNADLILIMGGNAAEAHPCGFKWVTEAKARNKARLIVVDPRFTRSASVADMYAPIRTGTDIAFLGGLINYLLENDKIQHEYVVNYTDVSFIVKEGFGFEDGLFNGYDAEKRSYPDKST